LLSFRLERLVELQQADIMIFTAVLTWLVEEPSLPTSLMKCLIEEQTDKALDSSSRKSEVLLLINLQRNPNNFSKQ